MRFFKKGRSVLCQRIYAKYAFMKQQQKRYSIVKMAQWLELSRSGFYAWLKSNQAPKLIHRQLLEVKIRAAHEHARKTYGTRRLQKQLAADDVKIGLNQLRYLRRRLGLRCIQAKKFKATTNSNHAYPVKENLLGQCFEPVKPNEIWVSDITYIPTAEGWLYLAGIKDVFTCEIVGYAMASRMTKELVSAALSLALAQKRPARGLILHSDRGSQYCSHDYQRQVALAGLRGSMSRKGNCYDNAPMESFWGSLKNELVHHRCYKTRSKAQEEITEYIEIFYNRIRRHSRLNDEAPAVFATGLTHQN